MKTFRLFKESSDNYYFTFTFKGERYKRCLETPLADEAQRRARLRYNEITQAILREDYPTVAATRLRSAAAPKPVDTLYELYRQAPVDAGPHTRETNIHAMSQLLTAAHPGQALTCAQIRGDTVRAWFAAAAARAGAEPDQDQQASIKRSANSRCIQAASLCTPRALDWYQSKGIPITGLEEFARTTLLCRFTRLPTIAYNPPDEALIARTLCEWEALPDGNLFRTVGLALAFALRRQEISQARWDWLTQRNGYPVLDTTASGLSVTVKNMSGLIQVRALDPYYSIFRRKSRPTHGETRILHGNPTETQDNAFRAVADWLHELGWKTRKAAHALRAYAGSQVAMRYSIYEAQTFLRHSTVKVTESHYSYFCKRFRPANLDDLPARWATAEPAAPVLKVVESGG